MSRVMPGNASSFSMRDGAGVGCGCVGGFEISRITTYPSTCMHAADGPFLHRDQTAGVACIIAECRAMRILVELLSRMCCDEWVVSRLDPVFCAFAPCWRVERRI